MKMEQILEIADYKIYTKEVGEGRPILLLHSYWGNQNLFDRLAGYLSNNFRVVLIDLPGHGKSGAPPPVFTFDQFAIVLDGLLSRLMIKEKVSIIGHSMGGYVAMAYATKYPEKIASLVLMHSPLREADTQSIKMRVREGRLLQKGKKDLLLQLTIPSNFAPANIGRMDDALAALALSADKVTLEGALGAIHAINHRANSLPALQMAKYPILVVIGKHDKVYNSEGQLIDAGHIPNAEVLLLECSGHLGFMEEEDLVFEKMGRFFINAK